MRNRLVALVTVASAVGLLVAGCASLKESSIAEHVPGTSAPTVGTSGAPGETNFDWPASSR
jgi:hypothetical protein